MLIDSHAHLNFGEFKNRWREVAADCLAHDIWVINVGTQYETSQAAITVAENFREGMYASIGLHPIHVLGGSFHPEEFDLDQYQALIDSSQKVVAIGETGIDFFHSDQNFVQQKEVFIQHILLAEKNGLPLIVHGRNSRAGSKNAYQEILKILGEQKASRGTIHCFGGTVEEAKAFVDLGFHVGFTGTITFKNAEPIRNVVAALPLAKILVETDAPYLAPEPYRGGRNQPQYVQHVAEKVAAVKGVGYNEVVKQTAENTINLFGL